MIKRPQMNFLYVPSQPMEEVIYPYRSMLPDQKFDGPETSKQ